MQSIVNQKDLYFAQCPSDILSIIQLAAGCSLCNNGVGIDLSKITLEDLIRLEKKTRDYLSQLRFNHPEYLANHFKVGSTLMYNLLPFLQQVRYIEPGDKDLGPYPLNFTIRISNIDHTINLSHHLDYIAFTQSSTHGNKSIPLSIINFQGTKEKLSQELDLLKTDQLNNLSEKLNSELRSLGIDWLTFESYNLTVTLTASINKAGRIDYSNGYNYHFYTFGNPPHRIIREDVVKIIEWLSALQLEDYLKIQIYFVIFECLMLKYVLI